MARIFSGIQPSGQPHIGNYLGAFRNWVREQNEDALYCVVDLHALTEGVEPEVLQANSLETAVCLLAVGLDPDVCTIFVQSHVPEHAQLSWLLECTASFGELRRMTQFKDKSARSDVVRGGLLTYPVLMAADIFLYETEVVPVGDDQRQHMELARVLAERFNGRYGETFVVPEAMVPTFAARVMDLQDPTKKMSKSEISPQGTVNMFDDADTIARKVRRAVTDTDGEVRWDRDKKPGVANLLEILAAIEETDPTSLAARYESYGSLKDDVAAALIDTLTPIQERRNELLSDPEHVRELLARGADRAAAMASVTYARAAAAIGLLAP